ncbi:unnamed protein product, partial [Ectocarpus fasciculatus]
MSVVVAALYHFADFPDCSAWRDRLYEFGTVHGIKGTMVVASEGLNGTVAGSREAIDAFLALIRSDLRFADLVFKESFADTMPFVRLRISVKNEIVTMREPLAKPSEVVGTYVDPVEWNDLISDPNVVVIDTRNDYEVEIGTFRNAQDPKTKSFCEFPDYVRGKELDKSTKVAMFCTGGIRCEKASSFMKREGFDNVYHLKGGILKYLEEVPPEKSMWDGECYVFDKRVAVTHGLAPGTYTSCFACRHPLTAEDTASEHHIEGIQCLHCHATASEKSRNRSIERQKQVELSAKNNDVHIGKK